MKMEKYRPYTATFNNPVIIDLSKKGFGIMRGVPSPKADMLRNLRSIKYLKRGSSTAKREAILG